MICYLDTSVAVKLYVMEAGTEDAKAAVAASSIIATSRVAYAEAMAAFARKLRMRDIHLKQHRRIVRDFRQDWNRYLLVEVSQQIVELAGELAGRRALRGYDAIHLASAIQLRERTDHAVIFLAADLNLRKAAKAEGLKTEPAQAAVRRRS
jgi:predicted nucleic acid-binding protein